MNTGMISHAGVFLWMKVVLGEGEKDREGCVLERKRSNNE